MRLATFFVAASLPFIFVDLAQAVVVRDHRGAYGTSWGAAPQGGVTVTSGKPRSCGVTIACGGGQPSLPPNVHDHRG